MSLLSEVNSLEKQLNLPDGFYVLLLKEDDWSFIIKLHTLIEAASTYVLTKKLKNPEIEEVISKLPMSDTSIGKLSMIKDLNILSKGQQKFIRFFSELRNKLVHKLENVEFNFSEYINALDKNQKLSFVENAGYGIIADEKKYNFVLENPKFCIHLTASEILACLRLEEDFIKLEDKKRFLKTQKTISDAKFEEIEALIKAFKNSL